MALLSETSFPADIVPLAAEDPNSLLKAGYKADKDERKVDLSIRAYRDENNEQWVLPVVKMAEEILRSDSLPNHESLPIAGLAEFTSASARLILGANSLAIRDERTISFQTISGTGALHLGALFLSKFYRRFAQQPVYVSNPTWGNHRKIFANVSLPTETYPYFLAKTKGFDFEGMIGYLQNAPSGGIIVLHACGHNPTGVDPTQEQWEKIGEMIGKRRHLPFFDCTYQGLASGNLAQDAWAIRHFVEQGLEVCIAQSFAKNCGLYGQRTGCFHMVTSGSDAKDTARRISSQLAILQRCEISSPPAYGARIASLILNDEKLFAEWEANLRTMSGRIIGMRKALRSKLEAMKTPGTWNHITDQMGMYCFLHLPEAQVLKLREDFHVYMTKNGRISMAGLNTRNIDYFAIAVDQVVKENR